MTFRRKDFSMTCVDNAPEEGYITCTILCITEDERICVSAIGRSDAMASALALEKLAREMKENYRHGNV